MHYKFYFPDGLSLHKISQCNYLRMILEPLNIIKTPSIKLKINLDSGVRGKFLHNSRLQTEPLHQPSTLLLSAKHSEESEGWFVTQLLFANRIERIGGQAPRAKL